MSDKTELPGDQPTNPTDTSENISSNPELCSQLQNVDEYSEDEDEKEWMEKEEEKEWMEEKEEEKEWMDEEEEKEWMEEEEGWYEQQEKEKKETRRRSDRRNFNYDVIVDFVNQGYNLAFIKLDFSLWVFIVKNNFSLSDPCPPLSPPSAFDPQHFGFQDPDP